MIKMKHIILSNYHLFRRPMDMHGQHSVGNGEISIEWWQWCQQWVSLFLGLGQLMTLSNCPLKVHRGAFSVRQLKLASLLHSTLLLCPWSHQLWLLLPMRTLTNCAIAHTHSLVILCCCCALQGFFNVIPCRCSTSRIEKLKI